jgi:hypothetical protein
LWFVFCVKIKDILRNSQLSRQMKKLQIPNGYHKNFGHLIFVLCLMPILVISSIKSEGSIQKMMCLSNSVPGICGFLH